MLLSFRQGLVQHEPAGFLQVSPIAVSLVVTSTPTIVTIASGTKDYLHVERASVSQAWGPITAGVDQWLYWDINVTSGARTFGITLLDPMFQPTAPIGVATDQHWFDTTEEIMKVWSGTRWVEKVRVFACKLSNGSVTSSMSPSGVGFTGTQVGLVETSYAGQIMFDSVTGNVLKAGSKFVTTEDVPSTQSLTKSDVKFASIVVQAEAQQPMDAYTLVKFTDFGKVVHADAYITSQDIPYGIIQQQCIAGDTVTVTTEGAVSSPTWNWAAAGVNAPLYCTTSGTLSTDRQIPNQQAAAMVIDTKTILLGAPRVLNTGNVTIGGTTLDALSDVSILGPLDNQVLTYDGSQWVNEPLPAPITDLNALTDVTLTAPVDNQVLTFDGAVWVNEALPPAPEQVIKYEGTNLFGPGINPGGSNNTVYGVGAMTSNLLGGSNVAIGHAATASDLYAMRVVAVGHQAMENSTTTPMSAENVYTGSTHLIVSSGDTDFVALGASSNLPGTVFVATADGPIGTTGTVVADWQSGVVAIGYQSMRTATFDSTGSSSSSVAIGDYTLANTTTGWGNVAIGSQALRYTTTGVDNVAIGRYALMSATGDENIAIGARALINVTATGNIGMNYRALEFTTTGTNNTGIGKFSLFANTTGSNNQAYGVNSMRSNTTGSNNIAVGHQAGYNLTTGSNNTLIGGYQGIAGLDGNIVLSTGNGTVRLQHDGTNWISATPMSMTGLILPSTTSPVTLNGSTGTAGQVLVSAGPGTTPVWANNTDVIAINTQAGNYTMQLSDAFNTMIKMTSASPNSVVFMNDSVIDLPIGSAVLISQHGIGQTSVLGDVGVTILSPDTLKINKQYGKITVIKTAANLWEIEGNIAPI